jgi:hypothetical protein
MNNDELMATLKDWARNDAHINPGSFACGYYDRCNGSVGDKLARGNGCNMSYVGRQFGLTAASEDGEGFRLMLVGIDHGEHEEGVLGANYDEMRETTRIKGIEDWYQVGGERYNSDYRAVVKTAATILGKSGQSCRLACEAACQKSNPEHGSDSPMCVLDRIARANRVKCTPSDQQCRSSRATLKMMRNCAHHLMGEIRLLQPNLVVFHGKPSRRMETLREFNAYDVEANAVGEVSDKYGSVLYKLPALRAHVLFLNHGAHNWLDRQWLDIVEPVVGFMRSNDIIPR